MNPPAETPKEAPKKTATNIFAILGFIILLIIGVWSAIQVVKFVPRIFGGEALSLSLPSFGKDAEIKMALSNDTIASGEPVTISWERGDDTDGILSFAYACKEGFHFEVGGNPIACNAPFNIPASDTELLVVPVLMEGESVDAPLAITYTDNEGESIRDTETLTVTEGTGTVYKPDDGKEGTVTLGEDTTPTTVAPTPAPKPVVKPTVKPVVKTVRVPVVRTSDPFGTADLVVNMVSIGAITPTGGYEPKGVLRAYERGAASFLVTNSGTKETGAWTFTASLPTAAQYAFQSQPQASIMPGASTEIFLTFDQLAPGSRNFTVSVDPFNQIPELSEHNNATGQLFSIVN